MNILILGHTGMLGNAVYNYLKQFYTVDIINYRWPSAEFIEYIKNGMDTKKQTLNLPSKENE